CLPTARPTPHLHSLPTRRSSDLTWEIGGHGDSDPARRCVAYDAPLGAALFGLKVGEYAEGVRLGDELVDLEVVALHASRPSGVGTPEVVRPCLPNSGIDSNTLDPSPRAHALRKVSRM